LITPVARTNRTSCPVAIIAAFNGSSGIAVRGWRLTFRRTIWRGGRWSNLPLPDSQELPDEKLFDLIPGPDFPTGGNQAPELEINHYNDSILRNHQNREPWRIRIFYSDHQVVAHPTRRNSSDWTGDDGPTETGAN